MYGAALDLPLPLPLRLRALTYLQQFGELPTCNIVSWDDLLSHPSL